MEIQVTFRKMKTTDAIRDYLEKRASKLFKLVNYPMEVHAILSVEKKDQCAEISCHAEHHSLVAHASTDDMYKSIDTVVAKLSNQMKKLREKRKGHAAAGKVGRRNGHLGADVEIELPHREKR